MTKPTKPTKVQFRFYGDFTIEEGILLSRKGWKLISWEDDIFVFEKIY